MNNDMSGGMGCVCGVPMLCVTYQVCCCDCRLYQSHSDNANERMLIMVCIPLLVIVVSGIGTTLSKPRPHTERA